MDEEAGFLAADGYAGPFNGGLRIDGGQGQGAGEVPGLWLRVQRSGGTLARHAKFGSRVDRVRGPRPAHPNPQPNDMRR